MTSPSIDKKIVVNEAGEPVEVIIPYDQYLDFVESFGLDMTPGEQDELREARTDIVRKNKEAFVSLDEVKSELGIEECTK